MKIGRKKGIAICFALFSVATVVNGFATTPGEFGICLFIAGLGCGGLMPNAVAVMNEYVPKRMRSTLVALMFSGYSLGRDVVGGCWDIHAAAFRLALPVLRRNAVLDIGAIPELVWV